MDIAPAVERMSCGETSKWVSSSIISAGAAVAGAQAADRQQREAAIGGGLAETDAELSAQLRR